MSDLVKASETFFWAGGKVDWDTEYPADAEVVKSFPHHFEPVVVEAPLPAPKKVGRPRKVTNG